MDTYRELTVQHVDAQTRVFEIFQYTGIRSHGTGGRAGFFRDAFDRAQRATV